MLLMKAQFFKCITVIGLIGILLACEKEEIPVSGINLSETSVALSVDSTTTLLAEIEPLDASNKTLKWSSSDPAIALVSSDGMISGVSPGTATITVESNDGLLKTCNVDIFQIIEHDPIDEIQFGASPFMAFDRNDNLWYGGYGGLYKIGFDGSGRQFYPLNTEVHAFDFDSKNNLWVATHSMGLLKFDGQTWSSYDTSNSEIPTNSITSIGIDNNDKIWMGLSDGQNKVASFDGIQWRTYESEECLVKEFYVFDIKADRQNNMWFAHYNGVSMFDGSVWSSVITDNKLTGLNVLGVDEDNENNIWFTSSLYGIFKYDGTNTINYNTKNSDLSSTYIQSIMVDEKGNIWLGLGGGISRFDGETWTDLNYRDFHFADIRASAIDSKGNKWFASPTKIYELKD